MRGLFATAAAVLGLLHRAPAPALAATLGEVEKHTDVLTLPAEFDPVIAAYWTGLPHHRRTPFAISPDGNTAYLAFLSAPDYDTVYVQALDPSTFAASGDAVKIAGAREAGGLVAQNDGFAVLVNIDPESSDVPYPVSTIVRYKDGAQAWSTAVNGPGVHESDGLSTSPDMNGDLVYSESTGLYAAYFVVTAYTGDAAGHYGDSIQYVNDSGEIQTITGASSVFGCSHNTGIALEATDETPYASVCAEDHGGIWLNTETQYMSGVKIANENTTNGVSGEPMGGMSGSYSNLARFQNSDAYIFAWATRGAVELVQDDWMGSGYTACSPRYLNHNAAISILSSKSTLLGDEAISTVGADDGDSQVNWITSSSSVDHQNIHAATFDSSNALVTYEILNDPTCEPVPLSCTGTFAGTGLQLVDSTGAKAGDAVVVDDAYVAGDIVNVGEKLCWPYVSMTWDLSAPKANGTYTEKISFACIGLGGASSNSTAASSSTAASTTAAAAAATSPAVEAETSSTAAAASEAPVETSEAAADQSTIPASTQSFDFVTTPTGFVTSTTAAAAETGAAETTSAPAAFVTTQTTFVYTSQTAQSTVTVRAGADTTTTVVGSEPAATSAAAGAAPSGWQTCTTGTECGDGMQCVVMPGGSRGVCMQARGGWRSSWWNGWKH